MWKNKNNQLYKKFKFADFATAMAFMNDVAELAEKMNHHPKWQNTYNIVEIWLSTHSEGGVVTDKDRQLAVAIDELESASAEKKSSVSGSALKEIQIYADGGSRGNPGPSAGGFAILDMDNNVVKTSGKYLGITTNNQAEYHSLKGAIEEAARLQVRKVHIYMDSLLVVNQMKGIYKIKNRDLWPIHQAIKEIAAQFEKVEFSHIPREMNKLADSIVNETLDAEKQ